MGAITMELREVMDRYNIGLDTYPIFDESYRDTLNSNITQHFWYREIGCETVDQFIYMLNARMKLIMPSYNELYKSTLIKYDPLTTVDMRTTNHQGSESTAKADSTESASNNTNTTNNSRSQSINSDYPAAMLSPSGDYASSGAHTTSESVATGETNATSKTGSTTNVAEEQEGQATTVGRQGSATRLMVEYREAIINIDRMIIDELDSLFLRVWDSGDYVFERIWYYA